jgi:long-chain acyl-CoA synthetase
MPARAQDRRSDTLLALVARLPRFGDRRAVGVRLQYGLRWWTYRELARRAAAAARALAAAGVGPGDRVALWGPSAPEWVGAFFGVLLRGGVAVPIDDGAPPETARRMIDEVGALHLVTVPGRAPPREIRALTFEDVCDPAGGPDGASAARVAPGDPAVIFFTSGTTSRPRGVVLTHENLMSQVRRFRPWRWIARLVPFRLLVSAPLSHAQGLMVGACVPLALGVSVIHTPFGHPGHLLRTIKDNRVTLLSTVPRILQVAARALERRPYGKSREPLATWLARTRGRFLRRHRIFNTIRPLVGYRFWVVIVGGARLAAEVETFWRNTGCLLVQGYGMTETAAIISVNLPLLGAFGSVGRPLGHTEVRIADDGEILVRGPNVSAGYYGGVEEPLPADGDYLRTGDLGRFDQRGRLYFEGRKKDVVVTGEAFNVYAEDVERVLDAQPGVRQAAVVGLERDGNTEVHAALLLEPGADAAAAVRAANARLAPHERVRGWTVWPHDDFPRANLFKVQRQSVAEVIRQRGGARAGAPSDGATSYEAILAIEDRAERLRALARYLAEAPADELAGRRARLVDDLGLGSLDVVELLFLLEARAQALPPSVVVEENATLADVGALLARAARADAEGGAPEAHDIRPLYRYDPPRWAEAGWLARARRLWNPLVLLPWMRARARLVVRGREQLRDLAGPCLYAVEGHEHGSDVITMFAALPARLRRRLGFVAGRWAFGYHLEPEPGVPLAARLAVGLAFHLGIPLFFPFALTPHFGTTREGLINACRIIDRGYSLIIFGGQGGALISRQTGVPVVPVLLEGNAGVGFRPRLRGRPTITVTFGAPGAPPAASDEP